jgi:hypothetical protein
MTRSLRVICPVEGCLIGWLRDSDDGPTWYPEDAYWKAQQKRDPNWFQWTKRLPSGRVIATGEGFVYSFVPAHHPHIERLAGACRHDRYSVDAIEAVDGLDRGTPKMLAHPY